MSDISKRIPLNCNIRRYCLCDTEVLKYPRICMSLVFEADEAKNHCLISSELLPLLLQVVTSIVISN